MKIITLVKAHYFGNPEEWGFRANYPWTVRAIWDDVLSKVEYDNCKSIGLMDGVGIYLNLYKQTAREYLQDWYSITKPEYIEKD